MHIITDDLLPLPAALVDRLVNEALAEDWQTRGDITSQAVIPTAAHAHAVIRAREFGVLAGLDLAEAAFRAHDSDLTVTRHMHDGDRLSADEGVATITGNAQALLAAERVALNYLGHLSGIASKTAQLVDLIGHTRAKICDTRKTTPGLRAVEKYAVRAGGAANHRFGLYDAILIKDNHIDFVGNVKNAIIDTKKYIKNQNLDLKIIVEARNLNEVNEIVQEGGINRILLDNFNYKKTKEAVKIINRRYETESSGNITQKNVLNYAKCGVDYVSMGALTNSIKTFDISLKSIK